MTDEDEEDFSQELDDAWYERKTEMMVAELGPEHDMVMHAIIPYAIGGGLDLYYFPSGIPGTAIATKELSEASGEGSSNEIAETYELVMFTRHALNLDDAHNAETPFGAAHANINLLLNYIAPYSAEATLNPYETCEFPEEMEDVGGKCLIFDAYGSGETLPEFGLLAIIEIFRSEMEYAREHGGEMLLEKLKAAGHYPYSDLDREPVV
jgi:hypothetical protein